MWSKFTVHSIVYRSVLVPSRCHKAQHDVNISTDHPSCKARSTLQRDIMAAAASGKLKGAQGAMQLAVQLHKTQYGCVSMCICADFNIFTKSCRLGGSNPVKALSQCKLHLVPTMASLTGHLHSMQNLILWYTGEGLMFSACRG